MSEGFSKAGILLFVLIAAGIGYGIYKIMDLEVQLGAVKEEASTDCDCDEPGVTNTWYTEVIQSIAVNYSSESDVDKTLNLLKTTIDVDKDEGVYISFTSSAKISPLDTLRHAMVFYSYIDEVAYYPGYTYEECLDDGTQDDIEWIPVSFFIIFDDLEEGTYDICLMVWIAYAPCPAELGSSTKGTALMVQTLNP